MSSRRLTSRILFFATAVWLTLQSGCVSAQSVFQRIEDARNPNVTPPKYFKGDRESKSPTLILFIHGIFGDTVGTWTGSKGISLPAAILSRPEFLTGYDAYMFGYPSEMLKKGSFSITQAAASLNRTWDFERFSRYKNVVIVAHSMGGLVALEALTTYSSMQGNVRLVVTYATPYNGSQAALIARRLIGNTALADMFPEDRDNGFINSLSNRWRANKGKGSISVKCAYETVPITGIGLIVPKSSGEALCDGTTEPIAADHIGIVKPSSADDDSVKVLTNALHQWQIGDSPPVTRSEPKIVLLNEIISNSTRPDVQLVNDKIQRNFASLLADMGFQVVAPPTSAMKARATAFDRTFSFKSLLVGETLEVVLQLRDAQGTVLATAEINGGVSELTKLYHAIPQALWYALDVNQSSLELKRTQRRPTENIRAFAYYVMAWRETEANHLSNAKQLLMSSVALDPKFAMAYWALGEIARKLGETSQASDYIAQANAIDPDHQQVELLSRSVQEDPTNSITSAIKAEGWRQVDSGLSYLHARSTAYGVDFRAWRLKPRDFQFSVMEQRLETGTTADDQIGSSNAILAVNGGFFKRDKSGRLTPDGLLVVNGSIRNDRANQQSGAVAIDKQNNLNIVWAKDLHSLKSYAGVIQSGPLLVEDGGKLGINSDDFNRLNRTAVCIDGNDVILVDVRGVRNKGLSLYQLATVLAAKREDGGLGCNKALNLDGGPSSQFSFRYNGKKDYAQGLWKCQNSLVVTKK